MGDKLRTRTNRSGQSRHAVDGDKTPWAARFTSVNVTVLTMIAKS